MKFYIVRHGQTEDNVAEIVTGQNEGILTEVGVEQARKLGNRLKNEIIDFVYSSDLARAKDTAQNIVEFFPMSKTIITNKLLRERDNRRDILPISEINKDPAGIIFSHIDGAETTQEVFTRIQKAVEFLMSKHDNDDNILIVAHGSSNRLLVAYLLGYDTLEEAKQVASQKNTALNIIEIDKNTKKSKAIILNCNKHLD